ncbi:TIGR02611 family protein [Microbacterium sp. NPDC055683]
MERDAPTVEPTPETTADVAVSPIARAGRATRRLIARNRAVDASYRVVVGTVGGVLTVGGLLLVPLPGPGWLIVFTGLAVLGTEFGWARRAAGWLKRRLEQFWAWWKARRARRRVS